MGDTTNWDEIREMLPADHRDDGGFQELIASLKEGGELDAAAVEALRAALYGDKGESHRLSREEVEFLLSLNEATHAVQVVEAWRPFFITAVAGHLTLDEGSEGQVDAEEAEWLIDVLEADGQYDDNEIALLEHLSEESIDLPMELKFRLGIVLSVKPG